MLKLRRKRIILSEFHNDISQMQLRNMSSSEDETPANVTKELRLEV